MNEDIDQWQEQQHARAIDDLRNASRFIVGTIDSEGRIRVLDGQPGASSFASDDALLGAMESMLAHERRIQREHELGHPHHVESD